MNRSNRAYRKQCEQRDEQYRHPLQKLPGAGIRIVEIGREVQNGLRPGPVMVRVEIVVMLIRIDAKHVGMAAVHIDVLMFSIRHMGMRMAQGRQHEADTHEQAKHAYQGGHRTECKRSTGREAMF